MDVTTAPHRHQEPKPAPDSRPLASLAPVQRTSPLRHGIMMGLATTASVALSFCCMLSVASRLGPSHRFLNIVLGCVSVLAGAYVGLRSWQAQKAPRPLSHGRCPDCGRELAAGDTACSLCGRKVGANPDDA